MRYEWDEEKRVKTLADRKIDFALIPEHFDWDLALYRDDFTRDEPRTQAIGHFFDDVIVVVYTVRGEICRIISARKAEPRERRAYERK